MREQGRQDWLWGEELDAVRAAGDSHGVILENESVRVIDVVIQPGVKEPYHTHKHPSVMIVDSSAKIRYYDADKNATEYPRRNIASGKSFIEYLEPEGLHAVENIDTVVYHATRIELKKA